MRRSSRALEPPERRGTALKVANGRLFPPFLLGAPSLCASAQAVFSLLFHAILTAGISSIYVISMRFPAHLYTENVCCKCKHKVS